MKRYSTASAIGALCVCAAISVVFFLKPCIPRNAVTKACKCTGTVSYKQMGFSLFSSCLFGVAVAEPNCRTALQGERFSKTSAAFVLLHASW